MYWFVGLAIILGCGLFVFRGLRKQKAVALEADAHTTDSLEDLMQSDLDALVAAPQKEDEPPGPDTIEEIEKTLTQLAPVPEVSIPTEDSEKDAEELVLVWDDARSSKPRLALARNLADPALMDVIFNEKVVARVPSQAGLKAKDIAMIPKSRARALGWDQANPIRNN